MTKPSFWQRLWDAAKDYWAAVGVFISLAFGAYDFLARFADLGLMTPDWLLPTWLILFALSGVFTVIQYRKKKRDLEGEKVETTDRQQEVGKIIAESNFQSGGQNIAAQTVNIFGRDEGKDKRETRLGNYDEIISLMNKAIQDAIWYVNKVEYEGEPSREEIFKMAYSSSKAFSNYFNDHRHYYSENMRKLLDELNMLFILSIQRTQLDETADNRELQNRNKLSNNLLDKSWALREQIIEEFRKNAAK